ncbi:hypothetical protein A5625_25980 [Mycobacterium sp. 1465703.0]|nr:hypothetical protein A5625_25980 [Mycobacterium sp. 1465703.0]
MTEGAQRAELRLDRLAYEELLGLNDSWTLFPLPGTNSGYLVRPGYVRGTMVPRSCEMCCNRSRLIRTTRTGFSAEPH